ncbi:hypothetical protein [Amycolatopsis sp. NPDC021455]|uniref:phage tail fiber protein n=1 Tax=Amycolatopsis sp. NPDC021455 TaxID=3154901 RepID=UPI0033E6EBDE
MSNLVEAEANRLLDASLGTAPFTAPTAPVKLALVTANGSATSAGTEVTGGGYARQSVTFSAASAGTASNTGLINFTNMPAATVVGAEIYDSSGTPRRAWFGSLAASKTTGAGDTLSFAVSALTVGLS